MDYEIMNIEEKLLIGITEKSDYTDENMIKVIRRLWGKFFSKGIYNKIPNRKTEKNICLYSNYRDTSFDITVCAEVNKDSDELEDTEVKVIPSGRYAKFIVEGHMQEAVIKFWSQLGEVNLNRSFVCDFEEYQCFEDLESNEIHMYISLK